MKFLCGFVMGVLCTCLVMLLWQRQRLEPQGSIATMRPPRHETFPLPLEYPGPWETTTHLSIVRVLVANDIRGCGVYRYRQSSFEAGKYLVSCNRDGSDSGWNAYLVWPDTQRARAVQVDPELR